MSGIIDMENNPPFCWGDEDGEEWFAEGHHGLTIMTMLVLNFEKEFGAADEFDTDAESLQHYYAVNDPDNEERYLVVDENHPGAKPMTRIARA